MAIYCAMTIRHVPPYAAWLLARAAMALIALTLQAEVRAADSPQPPVSVDERLHELQLQCEPMLADPFGKTLDKASIVTMQEDLIVLGYNPEWVDGIFGPRTRLALEQFCERAGFARSGDVLAMLRNHVAVFKAYPHWVETLASQGFEQWAAGQSDANEIAKTKETGDADSVIKLLERYRKLNAPAAVSRSPGSAQVSYMLSSQDFAQMRARGEIVARIQGLQGKVFAGKQELMAALDGALKGVADAEKYRNVAVDAAGLQTSRSLSEASFNKLQVENVPGWIVGALQGLKGLNYPADGINGALETLIGKVADFDPGEIVALAEVSKAGTVTFTGASAKAFAEAHKDDFAAAAISAKLQKLYNVEYQSAKTMTAAMKRLLAQAAYEIRGYEHVILSSAAETDTYVLTEASMKSVERNMAEFTMPEIYLEMLADMQGVDYPDENLFWLATKAKIEMAGPHNKLRKALFEDTLNKEAGNKVDEALLTKLLANGVPPAVAAFVGGLQGKTYPDAKALRLSVTAMFDGLAEEFEQYRSMLVARALKPHPFGKPIDIQWSGESCNCVHDNLAGQVYGFYPYWLAGEKQAIDFSVQTRLGFYALDVDDKGNILSASEWRGLNTAFIREAQRYGSKVDLVLRKDDWEGWMGLGDAERQGSFSNLENGIVDLLSIPLDGGASGAMSYVSLGLSQRPVMGDGVTLYFTGYPRDAGSVSSFGGFLKNLGDRLKDKGRKYAINLMFDSSEIGEGIYSYENLLKCMQKIREDGLDIFFVVLLREPTTGDKKLLRLEIESGDGIHGDDRIKLLRNVITVITYDGHNEAQLKDDVVYAKDNFGGIGFWPEFLMGASSVAGTAVSAALHDNYMDDDDGQGNVPGLCKYICPNKWAFRIAWGIFCLALLLAVAMRFVSCPWRVLFDGNFLYFIGGLVVPTFLLTLALLFCDPGWVEISRGNGLLIFVVLAIIGYFIWNYHDKKSNADLP